MKLLIIKPSSLGDVVHALPFLKAVKDSFPDAKVDWAINRSLEGLLKGNPLINKVITFDKDSWKSFKNIPGTLSEITRLKNKLRSEHYDIVVDLQGLLRSGLMTHITPASLKVGFADAREGGRYFYDKKIAVDKASHAVDKCLEIAKTIGAQVNKVEFPIHVNEKSKEKIRELLDGVSEYFVIAPSARWGTKKWPAESFASLIDKISLPCVIVGGKADRQTAQVIMDSALNMEHRTPDNLKFIPEPKNRIIDLCGKTDLGELTALISGARAVVSNDSGPMHIAAALDKPVIALFGPTDPVRTGPYGWQKNRNLKVITSGVPCSPCFRKSCKEFVCMNNISVDEVFKALSEYL